MLSICSTWLTETFDPEWYLTTTTKYLHETQTAVQRYQNCCIE